MAHRPGRPSPAAVSLDAVVTPRSVAVIGASEDASRIGGRPIRYMQEAGFVGSIFPVNPKHSVIQGLSAYPSIDAVPEAVDLALIAVPAPVVTDVLRACAQNGVKAAIVFSAGFAEIDAAGRRTQDDLRDISRETGIRVLGPNCLGAYNSGLGLFATFSTTLESRFPRPGPIGLVSQSGAYGSHLSLLATRRGLGIRYWFTTGNESDITVSECIEWMADRDDVSVIMAYAEGINAPDALVRALKKAAARRKPVVFMKVGRSIVGAQAALSHTASVAGSDPICDAVLRQYGAFRARTTEEMVDVAYVASFGTMPQSRRVALLTISGGVGVQMADAAADAGLDVVPLRRQAQEELKRDLPFASPQNPVDITAQAFNNIDLVSKNLRTILEDGRYGSVISFFTYAASAAGLVEPIRESLRVAREQHPECLIVLVIVGSSAVIDSYESIGCPVFEDPTRAVRAVAALTQIREWLDTPVGPAREKKVTHTHTLPEGPLDSTAVETILHEAGIPMASFAPAAAPAHDAEGIDLTVGVARDSTFGPVVRVGLSGLAASVLGDRSFRLAPVDHDEALRMIRDLKSFPLLNGTIGYPVSDKVDGQRDALDLSALAETLVRLSRLATDTANIQTVDIEPLRVFRKGHGAVALRAVMTRCNDHQHPRRERAAQDIPGRPTSS